MNKNNKNNVWVEKYRPTIFQDVVLDDVNHIILNNILTTGYFPNLLFYGPPGTGKTTTINNLLTAYHKQITNGDEKMFRAIQNELIIQLNASDERGIDTIRSQIYQFVNSKTLLHNGIKFIILDEVDYMTKNAQQALRYLLQQNNQCVRFCLICNYISRIDEGLQNEFVRLRFNQLPEDKLISFITNISEKENMHLPISSIRLIQKLYKSDVRSMINFMQTNQTSGIKIKIIDNTLWENLYQKLTAKTDFDTSAICAYIKKTSAEYNIDVKKIMTDFFNYIVRHHIDIVSSELLDKIENVVHFEQCQTDIFVLYTVNILRLCTVNPLTTA